MMEQYQHLKDKAGDALLFFRMGDFYELFHADAIVASKALNIALTARNKQHDDPIPMCGVPIHSAESYIDRLLQQGFKVAIAEQLEDPSEAEGLVKRDIVRVITPGTIVSGNALAPKEHNFLASIAVASGGAGFAYVDVSTGTFAVTAWDGPDWQQALYREYTRIQPREVLIPEPLEVRSRSHPTRSTHFCHDLSSPGQPTISTRTGRTAHCCSNLLYARWRASGVRDIPWLSRPLAPWWPMCTRHSTIRCRT